MATGESGNPERAPGGEIEHPDLDKLGDALSERVETRSVAVTGLFVLAVFYTLYFARAFFLPIVLAVLLDFLLSPVVRFLKRLRVPEPLSAALLVALLLGLIGGGVYSLADPARSLDGQGSVHHPNGARQAPGNPKAGRASVPGRGPGRRRHRHRAKMACRKWWCGDPG